MLTHIQNIEINQGLSVEAVENLLTGNFLQFKIKIDLENTKSVIIDCIKFTLLNNISENTLGNKDFYVPESLTLLIQKVLSLSRETKDGEMIYNLMIILFILSTVLPEKKSFSLLNSIFTSCTARKGD